MDFKVVHYNESTSQLEFKMDLNPKTSTGFNKLIQMVYVQILKTPGRDIIDPEEGGGLYGLIGSNIDIENMKELFADITARIKEVERTMLEDQAGLDRAPEELLQQLILVDLRSSSTYQTDIEAIIKIINQTGEPAMARIPITTIGEE